MFGLTVPYPPAPTGGAPHPLAPPSSGIPHTPAAFAGGEPNSEPALVGVAIADLFDPVGNKEFGTGLSVAPLSSAPPDLVV